MSTKSSKKLSFLLYDEKKGPVFVKTDKGLLKFTLYALPVVTLVALIVVLAGSVYFKQIAEMARRKEPAIIKDLKAKNAKLATQLTQVTQLNNEFEKKLSSTSTKGAGFPTLSLFRSIPGQEDLSTTPMLGFETANFELEDNKVNVKFDIINQTTDGRKLSGYIHIHMATPNKMSFYPQNEIASEDMLLSYNQGESFAFSRLRHVNASFDLTGYKSTKALFKVLIFSRTGDILLKKLIAHNIK
jgi:hypothetical protein